MWAGSEPVAHLLAPSLQLVSMSRTASSLASDRVSYGSSASKSECPRQQVLGEASVSRGLVDCPPKNSSKCKRGAGSTATAGSRRSIAGLASDARCAGSSRSSVVFAAPRALADARILSLPESNSVGLALYPDIMSWSKSSWAPGGCMVTNRGGFTMETGVVWLVHLARAQRERWCVWSLQSWVFTALLSREGVVFRNREIVLPEPKTRQKGFLVTRLHPGHGIMPASHGGMS